VPTSLASGELVTGYRDAVEAILRALEHGEGSTAVFPPNHDGCMSACSGDLCGWTATVRP
jgi:hypothetical protein